MTHFNQLTPAELERLTILSEECAEVIQIVSKIQRHGYASVHPTDPDGPTNRMMLEKEIGDVLYMISFMEASHDVNHMTVDLHSVEKGISIRQYLHHN